MKSGRVGMGRPVPIRLWARLLAGAAILGCASIPPARPHPVLESVWSDYRALPAERALAIAGDLRRNHWVAGASGGHATRAEAETGAVRQCREHRARSRIVRPCRIYAVGDGLIGTGGERPAAASNLVVHAR